MTLILAPWVAQALYGDHPPPDVITAAEAPPRWPLDKPWPPQVTLTAPRHCWRCVTRPRPVSPFALYLAARQPWPIPAELTV